MVHIERNFFTMAPLSDSNSRKRQRYDLVDSLTLNDEALISVSRKRVRFACHRSPSTDSTGSLFGESVAEDIYESSICFDDVEKVALWWSRDERTEIADTNRKLARGFKRQHADRVEHYMNVFQECSKPPSHSSSDFLETATLGCPIEVRGLECGFIPSVKSYRKKHAQEVLETQVQLMKGRLEEEVCRRVLSARALRSSRPSRVMARLIGEADAVKEP